MQEQHHTWLSPCQEDQLASSRSEWRCFWTSCPIEVQNGKQEASPRIEKKEASRLEMMTSGHTIHVARQAPFPKRAAVKQTEAVYLASTKGECEQREGGRVQVEQAVAAAANQAWTIRIKNAVTSFKLPSNKCFCQSWSFSKHSNQRLIIPRCQTGVLSI
ncbi:Hypothetical predicted protein [Cloeon dipterum]|uniref:Uncharacterized protein n=1 Tax=Cloeon dipterum TaxID=197152 RepID=A0A8S1DP55_9INSE|nr:Hypothetical predicted protein [Cloeon dipterum]